MSFDNVIVKNTNLNRELRHNSNLLENLFKGLYKEFERTYYPIVFKITGVASTSTLTDVGIKHKFPFAYLFEAIAIVAETNNLVEVGVNIDGQHYPIEGFALATTNSTPTKLGFKGTPEGLVHPLKLFVPKSHEIQLSYINTHGSNQEINVVFHGYRVSQKEALLTIKKGGVVRYEA